METYYEHYLAYPLSLVGIADPPMTYEEAKNFLEKEAQKKQGPEPLIRGEKITAVIQKKMGINGSFWEHFQCNIKEDEKKQRDFIQSQLESLQPKDEEARQSLAEIKAKLQEAPPPSFALSDPTLLSVIDTLPPGTMIDLGCGYQANTVKLLEKGWQVIALDSCQKVLDDLKEALNQIEPKWVDEGKICFVSDKMEEYTFPKNVQLIFAQSLPYCPPDKVISLWDNIYDSLEEGGHLVGHVFPRFSDELANLCLEWVNGGWMAPRTLPKALLKEKGYQTLKCEYNKYWFERGSKRIIFWAQKPLPDKIKQG